MHVRSVDFKFHLMFLIYY